GSNRGIDVGLNNLFAAVDLSLAQGLATVTRNPARLLDLPVPTLNIGQPANLIVFRCQSHDPANGFELCRTCVDGRWAVADPDRPRERPSA
ncbi:hypothetical protein ACYOEI_16225, partial [Singulisphaera rosea]